MFALEGTLLGLHRYSAAHRNDSFTEFGPGLDHITFGYPDREALNAWAATGRTRDLPRRIVDAHSGPG